MMKSTGLLARLQEGRVLTGMQCFSASPVLVEAMGAAGLDFVTLDMEHCPTGMETIAHLLRATGRSALVPLVRVPELDRPTIGRVLDLGAAGIVIPHATPERAREAVRFCRYEPEGIRGACPVVRAANYLPGDWNEYACNANASTLVVPLIEDAAAIEDASAILDVEGVDIVFVGPFDLAMNMGLSGSDYRHPRLMAALERVVRAAESRGKFVMTTVGGTIDRDYAATLLAAGVRLMSFSADIAVFLTACKGIAALAKKEKP
jgi:4-hydroxy-2-oxoheptanedioate aldolase